MANYDETDHAPRLHEPVVQFALVFCITGIMMVKQISLYEVSFICSCIYATHRTGIENEISLVYFLG